MGDPSSEGRAARTLIQHCLSGDTAAVARFQQEYGELIYGYPLRVYRTPAEDAGDFYVFAFENGRIFRRLRTFEGRAPLRAYLLGFVLEDLVLEWKRREREIETVSIEGLDDFSGLLESGSTLAADPAERSNDNEHWGDLMRDLEPAKAVVMKLLYIEDYELTPPELRHITKVSSRAVPEVLGAIEQLRATVREREAALQRIQDTLEGVHAWIQLYERRLRRIAEDLACVPPTTMAAERLRDEQAQLEHKIRRRQHQRTKLLAQAQRRKVTAPYKDIAMLLNTSVGNIASQIARVRQDLLMRASARDEGLGTGGNNG